MVLFMEKRTLYTIIAVVLVGALILSFSNLTGRSIGECIDTDEGNDPSNPGSVSFTESNVVYKDECYSKEGVSVKTYLKERYCLIKMGNKIYKCETGCLENEKGEGYCKEGEAKLIEN